MLSEYYETYRMNKTKIIQKTKQNTGWKNIYSNDFIKRDIIKGEDIMIISNSGNVYDHKEKIQIQKLQWKQAKVVIEIYV